MEYVFFSFRHFRKNLINWIKCLLLVRRTFSHAPRIAFFMKYCELTTHINSSGPPNLQSFQISRFSIDIFSQDLAHINSGPLHLDSPIFSWNEFIYYNNTPFWVFLATFYTKMQMFEVSHWPWPHRLPTHQNYFCGSGCWVNLWTNFWV